MSNDNNHPTDELLAQVYDELRRLAAQRLSREKPGQTLEPTALVHEAFIRIMEGRSGQNGMGGAGANLFGSRLLEGLGGLDQGSGGVHHVV